MSQIIIIFLMLVYLCLDGKRLDIVLVEAMKFRLPIISSKHIGNKDWIDKFNIFKVDQENKNQLKKHIKKII